MSDKIETLLSAYESGACTRRQFLAAVSALLPVAALGQTKTATPFVARGINHVTLNVKDLGRSREFYERLFQFPHAKQVDKDEYYLGMGNTFLFLGASHESSIDHFCIGIDGYDPQTTKQKLASHSVDATIEYGNQLYFHDPDGLKVQLSSPEHEG